MFAPLTTDIVAFDQTDGPWLVVAIDAEEEFDWSVISPASQSVKSLSHQAQAQDIFDRYGLKPVYYVDYAVVRQRDGYAPLKEFHDDGRCLIGAHLHPWVNPPIREEINQRNSFPGNLSFDLEREKLARLTDKIEERFGQRPNSYRAGRYGAGPNTGAILEELNYLTDLSVLPYTDLRPHEGPDFQTCESRPYWFGPERSVLEIPTTVGLLGLLAPFGGAIFSALDHPSMEKLKVWALLARSRLLDRIKLTPEGISLPEAKRLTRALLDSGHRTFVLTYHSSSLMPGNTPYVRTQEDLDRFLAWLDAYLAYFREEIGGAFATPNCIHARAIKCARAPTAASLSRPAARPDSGLELTRPGEG